MTGRWGRAIGAALVLSAGATISARAQDAAPTFHEAIEPLFQRHCQECHRPGGSGPFALLDYDDAKGWAAPIGEVVATRRMPPWHADRTVGKFANDRSLPDATITAITRWVAAGAPRGDPAKAPLRRTWRDDWSLDDPPDLVVTTPPFAVPAEGVLRYEYVRLPTGLAEPRWLRAAELKSSHPELVHHALLFLDEGRGKAAADAKGQAANAAARPWRPAFNPMELMQGAKPGEVAGYTARFQEMIRRDLRYGEAGGLNGYFLSGLSGGGAVRFGDDEGKWLPAGAEIIFQLHYQPDGTAAESSSSLALWFADAPRRHALDTRGVSTVAFVIPPGAEEHEVRAEYRLPAAATLRSLQPHMHRRGRSFTYFVRHADGREERLLHVPRYDFDWQHEYVLATPLALEEGDVLRVVACFDNSAKNPENPDPTQPVYFGLQTHEEMVIGYFEVIWRPGE